MTTQFSRPGQTRTARRAALVAAGLIATTAVCGVASAQTSSTPVPTSRASDLEARVDGAVRMLKDDPRFKNQTDEQRRDRVEFVAGNVLFALMHEVGHMLIAEMGLPVLGREEDAADAFATLTGLKMGDAFSDRVLMQSARGWFLSDRRNESKKVKMVFYDEHGLDRQRAYNIVCLMVGGNPEKFGKLATMTDLPEQRQGTCQGDYSNASWSWDRALSPHLRKPDQPKTDITVSYGDGGEFDAMAQGLRKMQILETVAAYLSDRYAWRRPVGLEMKLCDQPAARWDLSTRKIMVCYELAVDFAWLYGGYAAAEK